VADEGGQPQTVEEAPAQEKKAGWFNFTATNVYALFGFVTALVSFVFIVDPALRPDPRENQIASMSAVALDRGITFRGYAARVGGRADQLLNQAVANQSACNPGNVVYLDEHLQGFKNRDATLKYLTLSATTDQRVRAYGAPAISGGVASRLTGDVTSDEGVSMQWVQWPIHPGTYFVRFELFSGGNLLTLADTKKFVVTKKRVHDLVNMCMNQINQGYPSEGPGYSEASFGRGGGIDVGQWLLYITLFIVGGLVAALVIHGIVLLRRRKKTPGAGTSQPGEAPSDAG
jgi:hypothetical protein